MFSNLKYEQLLVTQHYYSIDIIFDTLLAVHVIQYMYAFDSLFLSNLRITYLLRKTMRVPV